MSARAIKDALAAAPDYVPRRFRAVTVSELLKAQFPPREKLLEPWLTTQSLTMLYSWRGVGKTHVALNIAYAVASGGRYLRWAAERPRKVLYLDGEMPGNAIQHRLSKIVDANEQEVSDEFLRILTPDMQPDGMTPNLASLEGQEAINAMIESDTALIIVDNLSALARGRERENDAESWQSIAEWALPLRAKGHSVMFVHHSGKNGSQRGTSKKEDLLDAVLCLRRPDDYQGTQGARFQLHFEKARGLFGGDVETIEASLTAGSDGKDVWTWRTVEDATLQRAVELKEEGASANEIAEELGLSRFQVNRLMKKAQASGLVDEASFRKGGKRAAKSYTEVGDDD